MFITKKLRVASIVFNFAFLYILNPAYGQIKDAELVDEVAKLFYNEQIVNLSIEYIDNTAKELIPDSPDAMALIEAFKPMMIMQARLGIDNQKRVFSQRIEEEFSKSDLREIYSMASSTNYQKYYPLSFKSIPKAIGKIFKLISQDEDIPTESLQLNETEERLLAAIDVDKTAAEAGLGEYKDIVVSYFIKDVRNNFNEAEIEDIARILSSKLMKKVTKLIPRKVDNSIRSS